MKKIRASNWSPSILETLLKRQEGENQEVEEKVKDIIDNLIENKDQALINYTEEFDGVRIEDFKVSEKEIEDALEIVEDSFLEVLKTSKENIASFNQLIKESSFEKEVRPGVILGQKLTPLERVGIYIPGGKASYPSTVLMTAVPAIVAGCPSISMVSPPNSQGKISPYILAAASIAGVQDIYKCGGAQGIAALAYGTESIPRVDKIVGPGNIYVATAKKMVFGKVDIDMMAGPSEVCILADDESNLEWLVADLLSQAEHDERAACVLITTSQRIFQEVEGEIQRQIASLPRKEILQKAIENYGLLIYCSEVDEAIAWVNAMAPEHLEILLQEPRKYLEKIKNAGAIFLGPYTPEAIGDYIAGPNHTLPTGGTARFSSPLGVYEFMKKSSILSYSKEAFKQVSKDVELFAEKEGLSAHARSIEVRS